MCTKWCMGRKKNVGRMEGRKKSGGVRVTYKGSGLLITTKIYANRMGKLELGLGSVGGQPTRGT